MEVVIEVGEKASDVVIEVLSWVHYHRIQDKATQYDVHGHDYPKYDRQGIPQIHIEVVG